MFSRRPTRSRDMLYRVDYTMALLLAGALAALLTARRIERLDPPRTAHRFLAVVAILTAIRVAGFVATTVLGLGLPTWPGLIAGDLGTILVGALYGLALATWRRPAPLLRQPALRFALCLSLGTGFAISGIAKMFALDAMTEFFTASGYSKTFLACVITGEILGGMALLLPSRAIVLATIAGLAVDIVGAITTHVHNGDPLDDSTGAIAVLFKLALLAALHAPLRRVAPAAALCVGLAIAGAAWQRHAPAPADDFTPIAGTWHCAGSFTRTGKHIEADLRAERVLDNHWLVLHYDDVPPFNYHSLSEWTRGPTGWLATIQDASGDQRIFHSPGWVDDQLVLTGQPTTGPEQRFVYRRLSGGALEISFDRADPAGWQRVDTVTCHRT